MAIIAVERLVPATLRCVTRFNAVVDISQREVRGWMMRIAELRSRQRSELVEVTDSPETGELLAYFYGAKTSLRKSHSVDFGMSYVTRERDQFQGSQYAIDANLDARIPAYKAMHPDVPAQVFQVPPPRRSPRSPSGRSAAPSNSSRDAGTTRRVSASSRSRSRAGRSSQSRASGRTDRKDGKRSRSRSPLTRPRDNQRAADLERERRKQVEAQRKKADEERQQRIKAAERKE